MFLSHINFLAPSWVLLVLASWLPWRRTTSTDKRSCRHSKSECAVLCWMVAGVVLLGSGDAGCGSDPSCVAKKWDRKRLSQPGYHGPAPI
eukprot:365347-Chlamydomonas_euryale.AAC.14